MEILFQNSFWQLACLGVAGYLAAYFVFRRTAAYMATRAYLASPRLNAAITAQLKAAQEVFDQIEQPDGGPAAGPIAPATGEADDSDSAEGAFVTYPVHYVSGRNSHSLLRWVPWDASGVLTSSPDGFHFEGDSPLGGHLELSFDPSETRINYQKGGKFWDGGMQWCVIEVDGEKHYFTSEVGVASPRTAFDTSQLYRDLTNRYLAEADE